MIRVTLCVDNFPIAYMGDDAASHPAIRADSGNLLGISDL
jgi:hypothetical protein